jgi:hypothetical protein
LRTSINDVLKKNCQIRYVAVDLDGTLLNKDHEVSEFTKMILQRFIAAGGILILASGRPTYGMRKVENALSLKEFGGILLSFNGGELTDCKTGEILYQKPLKKQRIPSLVQQAREMGANLLTYQDNYILTEQPKEKYCDFEAQLNGMQIKKVKNFETDIQFPIVKCLMTIPPERMSILETRLKEQWKGELSISHSQSFFLEITEKGIDKAQALDFYLNKRGDSREKLVAFGDGMNDFTMLRYAGLGVAMGNAELELKQVADLVCLSNEEDGVARLINELINNT